MEEQVSIFEPVLDREASEQVMETSRWQSMLGWLMLIGMGLLLVALFFGWNKITEKVNEFTQTNTGGVVMTFAGLIIILVVIVAGLMAFLLIRSGKKIREGVRHRNQAQFNDGLKDLKIFFIIFGILSILGLLGNLASLF